MKSRKTKINNSSTTCALVRVNRVSIDYLEMDYKRRLSLSEVQGLLNKRFEILYNGKAMIGD